MDDVRKVDIRGVTVIADSSLLDDRFESVARQIARGADLLRAARLDGAWYGQIFLFTDASSAAGNYNYRPDTIRLYIDETDDPLKVVVHEMGHRYWYKSLSPAQRAKFESLVRTFPDTSGRERRDDVTQFKTQQSLLKTLHQEVNDLGRRLPSDPSDAKAKFNADYDRIQDKILESLADPEGVSHLVMDAAESVDDVNGALAQGPKRAQQPIKAAQAALKSLLKVFEKQHAELVANLKKKWDAKREQLENDSRPVFPVSDYGKTHTNEAFAEVFAYYVLGRDMNRDQLESFRAVL